MPADDEPQSLVPMPPAVAEVRPGARPRPDRPALSADELKEKIASQRIGRRAPLRDQQPQPAGPQIAGVGPAAPALPAFLGGGTQHAAARAKLDQLHFGLTHLFNALHHHVPAIERQLAELKALENHAAAAAARGVDLERTEDFITRLAALLAECAD